MKPFLCYNCLVLSDFMKYPIYIAITIFSFIQAKSQNMTKAKLSGTISGSIQNTSNGKPIAGSSVYILSKNKTINKITTSDKNGEFVFENLPFENYQLQIKALGFARYTIDSYSENNVRNFKLTLSYQFNKTYTQKLITEN